MMSFREKVHWRFVLQMHSSASSGDTRYAFFKEDTCSEPATEEALRS